MFSLFIKVILKLCIVDETTDGITYQLEVQFSSKNISANT
jgi:hypothetical protein